MAKRPADFTAQIQAEAARKRQRAEQRRKEEEEHERKTKLMTDRQVAAYGKIILAVAGTRFDVDQLAGILRMAIRQAEANPQQPEVWRKEGDAFFRPANGAGHDGGSNGQPSDRQPARDDGANKRGNGRRQDGGHADAPASSSEPARQAAPGTPDLLGGLAPARPGPGPAAEA